MDPSDTIIQLIIAKFPCETERLNVHRGVLCKSSEFFQKAVKPEWTKMEAGSNTIDLPDDSASTVSDYIKWLYYDKMPIKLYNGVGDTREKKAEESEKIFVLLAEAYVFGEKIIDVKYKNAVVKTMFAAQELSGWSMGPECIKVIYEGTPSGSPLRRFFAEDFAHKAHDDSKQGVGWMQFVDAYPREALVDAMKAMVKARKSIGHPNPRVEPYLEEE